MKFKTLTHRQIRQYAGHDVAQHGRTDNHYRILQAFPGDGRGVDETVRVHVQVGQGQPMFQIPRKLYMELPEEGE